MRRRSLSIYAIVALLSLNAILASRTTLAAEVPVAAEKNPPGDIPDSQVFIAYTSPLGFTIKVPEGWPRTDRPDGVTFADKFGAVDVTVSAAATAPTSSSVKAVEAAALEQSGRAVKIDTTEAVGLPAGPAVLIKFHSNSEPNAVTSKRIRLEHDRYLIQRGGKLVTIDFSAPAGADNVDQWKLMSQSFEWK